ncbi:hypothetical protein E9993_09515 [Labilibacter sediminis]|nr:hypothetical protein E9993_09515 [Labilibacter sediminis]
MRNKSALFLLVLFMGVNTCMWANNFKIPQVTTFYKHQYHASNRNWGVAHGKDGYVYIGNEKGLLSFDGVNWKLYELPNHSRVRSICVSSKGIIYTGSAAEIGYWKRDKSGELKYTSLKPKMVGLTFHNQDIWRIFEDEKKQIIFQGFSLILKYNGHQVASVDMDAPPSLMVEFNDRLIGGTRRGNLVELTEFGLSNILHSEYLRGSFVKAVLPLSKQASIIATNNKGFFIWENSELKPWQCEANDVIASEGINCALSQNGYYYIGTVNSGIYVVNTKGKILYQINSKNHLQDNTILFMQFDDHQRLWFTMSVGVGYAELNNPLNLIIDHSRNIGAVHDVAFFNDKLYLATNKGVFYTNFPKGSTLTSFRDFHSIPELIGLAWSIKVIDNQLLCGHNKGTFLISEKGVKRISRITGGKSYQLFKIKNNSYVVQNTYTELVVFKKDENREWVFNSVISGFYEPTFDIAVDHKNQIWAQHIRKNELYSLRLQENLRDAYSYNVYRQEQGLPLDMSSQIAEFNNRIVITSSNGLYTYDQLKDSIVYYDEINKQLGEYKSASKIKKQSENFYWFIKGASIALYDFSTENAGKIFQYSFDEPHVGLVERFENIVSIESIGSFICLENGIAFISDDNLKLFNQKQSSASFALNVRGSYSLRGKKDEHTLRIKNSTILELPYKHSEVKLNIATLAAPGKILHLKYTIENDEEKEVHYTTNPDALLNRLKPGRSKVSIEVVDMQRNDVEPLTFFIEVEKPFYLKLRFLLIFGVVLVLVIFTSYYRFKRNLNKYIKDHKAEGNNLIEPKKIGVEDLLHQKEMLEEKVNAQNNQIATGALNSIRNKEVLTFLKSELTEQKEILGVRYPDKYYKKLVDLIDTNIHVEDDWVVFEKHFDEANGNFFSKLKEEFPQLTPRDLRLCAYLKMNLSSKEISPLLNISERSVEVHRYRLRKKLNLSSNSNLSDFMIAY